MPRRLIVTMLLVLACALSATGCAQIRAQMDGAQATDADAAAPATEPLLMQAEWSVSDGLLSVIVRNTRSRTLRTAQVSLQAFDDKGLNIGTFGPDSVGGTSACCTVVELAPKEQFGLYYAIGPRAADVASVKLTYENVSWVPNDPTPSPVAATPGDATLDQNRTDVAATLTNRSNQVVPSSLVQAILRGRGGKLIAVVTGRWSCLMPNERRAITMQLFQPVPAGARVTSVTARPVTLNPQPSCAAAPVSTPSSGPKTPPKATPPTSKAPATHRGSTKSSGQRRGTNRSDAHRASPSHRNAANSGS